ncbi:MAG: methyltransferase domain-containing protein [Chloroflexi bacterium]|nr:methyltransferase domain-containing protein [Chloroflexota bacterium]
MNFRGNAGRAVLWLKFMLLQRSRHRRLVLEHVAGLPLVILPEVFNPALFYSSLLLAQEVANWPIHPQTKVLDLGTGSGLLALTAARRATQVVATDINPAAIRCLQINALLNHLEQRIAARVGDLFDPVAGEQFDLIFFNPPYFPVKDRKGSGLQKEAAWNYAWHDFSQVRSRFTAQVRRHLLPAGQLLLVDSDRAGSNIPVALGRAGLQVHTIRQKELLSGETLSVYAATHPL